MTVDSYPLVPAYELKQRVKKLSLRLKERGVDACLILGITNLYYFTGTVQNGALLVFEDGSHVYLVRKSYERACHESSLENIVEFGSLRGLADRIREHYGHMPAVLGFEASIVPVSLHERYKRALPECRFIDFSTEIRTLRSIKSEFEVACVREAGKQVRSVFEYLKGIIRPGMTELEISAEAEGHVRRMGHQGVLRMHAFNAELFYGVVCAGENANLPTSFDGPSGSAGLYPSAPHPAGRRAVVEGKTVLVDMMGAHMGYLCDETRIFMIGHLPTEIRDAQDKCVNIQNFIASRLKPGTLASDIYQETVNYAEELGMTENLMGYKENQVKFFGHGVGLEVDELPVIAPGFDMELQNGMVVAVEPKFYMDTFGGVGIENTFLVTSEGGQKLMDYPDDIIDL